MSTKKILRRIAIIAAVLFGMVLLLLGIFLYLIEYKIADIDTASTGDGAYTLLYQSVGEPDWPYGYSHARFVLKHDGQTVSKYKFDVANDGGILLPDSWDVYWEAACVRIRISGEEQPDAVYTLSFDGTVKQKRAAQ